jgi:hypothetical protein
MWEPRVEWSPGGDIGLHDNIESYTSLLFSFNELSLFYSLLITTLYGDRLYDSSSFSDVNKFT